MHCLYAGAAESNFRVGIGSETSGLLVNEFTTLCASALPIPQPNPCFTKLPKDDSFIGTGAGASGFGTICNDLDGLRLDCILVMPWYIYLDKKCG